MSKFFAKTRDDKDNKGVKASFLSGFKDKVQKIPHKMVVFNEDSEVRNNVHKINSFNTIFNQDQDQISGVKRVFRKSIIFLILSLVSFALVAFASINLFSVPAILSILFFLLYISTTIVFFLIVADRSYVWLCLLGHMLLIVMTSSFVGQIASIITWGALAIVAILYYLAYTEVEKSQLGSRLFSIHQIGSEATNLLITITLLTLSLGVFNSIVNVGTVEFINKNALENSAVFDGIIMGKDRSLNAVNLNKAFITNDELFGEGNIENTFEDFLIYNYKGGKPVILSAEEVDIELDCQFKNGVDGDCGNAVLNERKNRLTTHLAEDYPESTFSLDEVLNQEKYEEVVRQYYQYRLNTYISEGSSNDIEGVVPFLPTDFLINKDTIFPAVMALIIFVLGLILRSVLSFISLFATWVMWGLLKVIKFVRIDVETVEGEVVSI